MIRHAIVCALALFVFSVTGKSSLAHKGSPWHGNDVAAALGLNSIYLEKPQSAAVARFRILYPTQPNKLDYAVGASSTVIVFSNEELLREGIITEKNSVLAAESPSYDPSAPLNIEFEIKDSGWYHVLFGPGPNTSILVLEPSLTVAIEPVTVGAKAGQFIAPATSGDFHIIKNPTTGLKEFTGWFAVFFEEYTQLYKSNGLPTASEMALVGPRAQGFAKSLVERGYSQFSALEQTASRAITGPFMGHINGLSVEAFDSVYLEPGAYEFAYYPHRTAAKIMITTEVILQVVKDSSLSKGYGTEADVVARAELSANLPEYRLRFSVSEPGYYHLSYGPGEGGFIFHMTEDELLPTEVIALTGSAKDHVKLVGINSVVVGQRPLQMSGSWQVFFPCKAIQSKAQPRGILSNVSVPLTVQTALSVSRLSAAIMHPIMIEYLRDQKREQDREIMRLRSSPRQ